MSTSYGTYSPITALPFDVQFLRILGSRYSFMDNDQIMTWIDSVMPNYIQDWYTTCVKHPKNQAAIAEVKGDFMRFANELMYETGVQHNHAQVQDRLVSCPCEDAVLKMKRGELDFKQHTAVVACLISRYGIRGGPFQSCEDFCGLHLAAVYMLVTVLIDLTKSDNGWFGRRLRAGEAASGVAPCTTSAESGAVESILQKLEDLSVDPDQRHLDISIEAMQAGMASVKLS